MGQRKPISIADDPEVSAKKYFLRATLWEHGSIPIPVASVRNHDIAHETRDVRCRYLDQDKVVGLYLRANWRVVVRDDQVSVFDR